MYDSWTDAIPDIAFKPTSADDRDLARKVMAANKRQRRTGQLTLATMFVEMPADLVALFDQLGAGAEDSVAEVTIRAETYEGIQRRAEYRHLLQQANVWTAWFWPLRPDEPAPPTQALFATLATGHGSPPAAIAERLDIEAGTRRFFHFELEFPDVFTTERGGFDVVVGNPPYLGGQKIGVTFGENTYQFLKGATTEVSTGGRVDLAAYFVRRGFDLLRERGELCLITTNTIGQGDTRDASLVPITRAWGGEIVDAVRPEPWEGEATVSVAVVHLHKGTGPGIRTLDGREITRIGPDLSGAVGSQPAKLLSNEDIVSIGTNVLGEGFWIDADERRRLLDGDRRNLEVIKPFIGGRQAMQSCDPGETARWVIDFDDKSLEEATEYRGPLDIVRARVKPHRDEMRRAKYRDYWWQLGERSSRLYRRVRAQGLSRVIAIPHVSKTLLPVFLPADAIYQDKLFVFAREDDGFFGVLTSAFHWLWAAKWCTTMRTDPTYNPSQIFKTLVLPDLTEAVEDAGRVLNEHRSAVMLQQKFGLTSLYNLVIDPANTSAHVACLRALHQELDDAVAAAYGWEDLDMTLRHHPTERFGIRWTVKPETQREIERRLLELNHERASQQTTAKTG